MGSAKIKTFCFLFTIQTVLSSSADFKKPTHTVENYFQKIKYDYKHCNIQLISGSSHHFANYDSTQLKLSLFIFLHKEYFTTISSGEEYINTRWNFGREIMLNDNIIVNANGTIMFGVIRNNQTFLTMDEVNQYRS